MVELEVHRYVEGTRLDPAPVREVAVRAGVESGEHDEEGEPHRARTDKLGERSRPAPAATGQKHGPDDRETENQQRQSRAHPRSSLSSSTSSTSRSLKMSTRMPRPTTASAAATVIDINAKSWPSEFWSCREKVTRVKLTAFSISSMQTRITSGLRRTRMPIAPMMKAARPGSGTRRRPGARSRS